MKLQYESTIDEAACEALRLAEFVGAVPRIMWYGLVVVPVIFFLFLFFVLLIDEFIAKLAFFLVATAVYVIVHLASYRSQMQERIRTPLIVTRGTDEPVPSEWEVDENGLVHRTQGPGPRFSWDNVVTLNETEDNLELIMSPIGIALIPKRVFSSPQELADWTRFILEHM